MRSRPMLAMLALLAAPVEPASASLYINDGTGGQCSQMLGSGVLGIQIPITIVANNACNVASIASLAASGAPKGTLSLNGNGAFLLGNLSINGAFDINGNQIHNLAAGVNPGDGVNVGQLTAVSSNIATALGGNATVNADLSFNMPTYTVQNTPVHDVGSALSALDATITSSNANILGLLTGRLGLVEQANDSAPVTVAALGGGTVVDVSGAFGNRRITGVTDGTQDNDAVNVSQLNALQSQIGDASALALQYDDAGKSAITLGGVGAASPVAIHNLADGKNAGDAANFGQLTGMAQSVATQLGGNAAVNADGTVSAPTYTVQNTTVHDVGTALSALDTGITTNTNSIIGLDGRVSTSENNIVSLDSRVTVNEGDIHNLLSGTAGLVQQAGASAPITLGAGSGGSVVNVAGTGGNRQISGVADGTQGNDAVNVNQLNALQGQIGDVGALALQYDDASKSAVTLGGVGAAAPVALRNLADGTRASDAATFGQLSGTAQSVAAQLGGSATVNADGTLNAPTYTVQNTPVHDVGAALNVLDTGVTTNAANIVSLDGRVTANEGSINSLLSGTVGLVQQADASAPVTVAASSGGSVVNVAGTDGDRQISGVADGTQDNDAVNVGQLKAVQSQLGEFSALAVMYDDSGMSSITLGGAAAAAPVALHNVANGTSAYDAVNYGQLTGVQSDLQNQIANVTTQVGLLDGRVTTLEGGSGTGGVPYLDGHGDNGSNNPADAGDTPGVALGYNAVATGSNAAAVGQNAQALGEHGTAIGSDAYAAGPRDTALGGRASVMADGSVAVGANASVSSAATNAVAVGADSSVSAASGTAIGQGASVAAAATNAVAIGAGSQATQANTVSVGSVGNERTVTNVAPGVNGTDAVNVSQLQAAQSWAQNYTDSQTAVLNNRITNLGRRADAGTASAIAMANIPQAYAADQGSIGAGVGSYRGQAAIAVGMSAITPGGRWIVKANITGSTQGDAGVGLGAAMVW